MAILTWGSFLWTFLNLFFNVRLQICLKPFLECATSIKIYGKCTSLKTNPTNTFVPFYAGPYWLYFLAVGIIRASVRRAGVKGLMRYLSRKKQSNKSNKCLRNMSPIYFTRYKLNSTSLFEKSHPLAAISKDRLFFFA